MNKIMLGIIICHKQLAFELIHTANAILGHHDNLYPFSNENLNTDQLIEKIENFLAEKGNPQQVIFMADLQGGNCWTVARILSHSKSHFHVFSGVNLPMILSFLTKKDQLNGSNLIESIENDARRGIVSEV